jgi:hypothetical protein
MSLGFIKKAIENTPVIGPSVINAEKVFGAGLEMYAKAQMMNQLQQNPQMAAQMFAGQSATPSADLWAPGSARTLSQGAGIPAASQTERPKRELTSEYVEAALRDPQQAAALILRERGMDGSDPVSNEFISSVSEASQQWYSSQNPRQVNAHSYFDFLDGYLDGLSMQYQQGE